jgi:L-iditol 2-dehydrogenase
MKTAKSMGADAVVDANMNPGLTAKVVSDLTNGIGADIVIVVASDPSALTLATKVASKNAKISLFAGMPKDTSLSLDANLLHYNQISLIGNFSATPYSMREAINLISQNRLDLSEMISHYYPLHNIEEALAATESFRGLRIVINRF